MAADAVSLTQRPRSRVLTTALVVTILASSSLAGLPSAQALAETTSPTCNLYASTSGSDSNSGTKSAPLLTAKRLLERLTAGQTGCLVSGQTFAGFTLYSGDTHGAEGEPATITSTNPSEPATIDTRVTTEEGADWLTFSHLIIKSDVAPTDTEYPSPSIGSWHTSWTYDDVSGGDINICFSPDGAGPWGTGEYTLIEHDRVHDCGHPVTKSELEAQANDIYEDRENGWHAHGLYDEGQHTTVKNSYFFENSGVGILLRGGSYAVIEHNVIDGNGRGVLFGDNDPSHDLVAWNIITNTTTPCGKEVGKANYCDSFGVSSYCQGGCSADVFRNNDLSNNEAGNIAPPEDLSSAITLEQNVEVDPLYVNAAAHEYTLQAGSPAVGYGPDTAQPTATPAATTGTTAPPRGTPPPARRGGRVRSNKGHHSARAAKWRSRAKRHRHVRHAKRNRQAKATKLQTRKAAQRRARGGTSRPRRGS